VILPEIEATLPATFPTRLITGTIFLENQVFDSGDEDENDIVFEMFSRTFFEEDGVIDNSSKGIIINKKIIYYKKRNLYIK